MVKKGYKQTEIGMVPGEWSVSDFGSKVKIYRGGSPRPIHTVSLLKSRLMCYNISGDENEEIRDNH